MVPRGGTEAKTVYHALDVGLSSWLTPLDPAVELNNSVGPPTHHAMRLFAADT